jgi:hypothetical protein
VTNFGEALTSYFNNLDRDPSNEKDVEKNKTEIVHKILETSFSNRNA